MSLNSNTWYTIQSFGTDYNLAASNSSGVTSQSDGQAANALWQVQPSNGSGPSYLRTKQTGSNNCLSGSVSGTLALTPCTNSTVWTIALFNGQNTGDGYFLGPGTATSPRLSEASTGNMVSLRDYTGPSNDDVYFQWAFKSVSAINEASFSGVPGSSPSTSAGESSGSSSPPSPSSSSPSSSSSSLTFSSPMAPVTLTLTNTVTAPTPSGTGTGMGVSSTSTRPGGAGSSSGSPTVSPTTVPGSACSKEISLRNVLVIGLGVFVGLNIL